MPWAASDAETHIAAANTPKKKTVWAQVANEALDKALKEGKSQSDAEAAAVAQANSVVGKMGGDDAAADAGGDRSTSDDIIVRRDMALSFVPRSFDVDKRTADAMLSTGARVRRRDWEGEFDEVLDMSPQSVRLARLNAGAQLLDSHSVYGGIDDVLGAVLPGTARIEHGQLVAGIKFSRGSEKARRVAQDLADGIPISLSVGYRTHREVTDNTTTPPTRMAVDWEPLEVSVVGVGAEAGAGFRGIGSDLLTRATPNNGEKQMPKQNAQAAGDLSAEQTGTENRGAGDSGENRAVASTPEFGAEYALEMFAIGRKARMENPVIETAIRAHEPVDKFRERAFDVLAGISKDTGPTSSTSGTTVEVLRDENEGRREAMTEALTVQVLASRREPAVKTEAQADWAKRQGKRDEVGLSFRIYDGQENPQHERTRQYLKMGFVEIAAECLGYRGHIRNPHQAYDIVTRAFQTTSDYPAIFENVLNKTMLARYALAMPTYREIAIERTFNDFRPHPQIRAGEFPMPLELTEAGELKAGASAESKETVSVKPYGRIYSISRQMIVNDEMGAIDQILGSAGEAVLIFENTTFFAMFASNPKLVQDSTEVFDASTHNNYVSSGSEPSILSIGAARAALRAMKSISGNFLNVAPSIILSGPVQETRCDQMTAMVNPVVSGSVNPFSGKLRNVTDANITGNEWYVFCEPGRVPCFVYGFLAGQTGPRIRTDEPFGVQGIRTSLEVDFGCGAIDYRGCYKDAGDTPTEITQIVGTKTIT